jgi:glycine C-acetyltransferase
MADEEPSLADFAFPDGDDPLVPPSGFSEWLDGNAWAMSLMEPQLLSAVGPRGRIRRGGADADVVNLSSYNYLGLATNPEVLEAGRKALEKYGTGGCGSPLLSGLTDLHRELETAIATWLGREDVMLFNSGFGGGVSTLAGLLRKGDAAVLDGKCHLCLLDGVKLSRAKMAFFEHNDAESLDQALSQFEGRRRLMVVEGVYSMDGDYAKLDELLPVAEKHGVGVMIDEAHSIGVYGEKGRGVTDKFGAKDRIALQYATFSKSFAHVGGFISGSRELLRYLRYYANGYGFSCTLPPVVVAGILKGLEVSTRDESLREKLWDNVAYFRRGADALGLNTGESTSQVFPIIIGDDRRALFEMGAEMNRKGLFLAPVDYPSVPMDALRYRVAITAAHEREDLDTALSILEDVVIRRIGKHEG